MQKSSPTLQLGESCLGDEGCAVLGRYLEEHDTVAVLDLHGNNISGRGIAHLSHYLGHTTALKQYKQNLHLLVYRWSGTMWVLQMGWSACVRL